MAKVRLARTQQISADGVVLMGTRDFDVDIELDNVDVTAWDSGVRAELPLVEGNTVTLEVYHLNEVQAFMRKWNKFPPEPVAVSIDGVGSANFLVHSMKAKGQFSGVLAYQVVLKLWPY